MTADRLGELLADAVRDAERSAPAVDPVTALAGARRRRGQRRGHLVALAFVASLVLLQLLPAEALAGDGPSAPVVVAKADPARSSAVHGG